MEAIFKDLRVLAQILRVALPAMELGRPFEVTGVCAAVQRADELGKRLQQGIPRSITTWTGEADLQQKLAAALPRAGWERLAMVIRTGSLRPDATERAIGIKTRAHERTAELAAECEPTAAPPALPPGEGLGYWLQQPPATLEAVIEDLNDVGNEDLARLLDLLASVPDLWTDGDDAGVAPQQGDDLAHTSAEELEEVPLGNDCAPGPLAAKQTEEHDAPETNDAPPGVAADDEGAQAVDASPAEAPTDGTGEVPDAAKAVPAPLTEGEAPAGGTEPESEPEVGDDPVAEVQPDESGDEDDDRDEHQHEDASQPDRNGASGDADEAGEDAMPGRPQGASAQPANLGERSVLRG